MLTQEFTDAYKQLNPEQKRAVDTIEGPVMVVAGPGTGKTQILTLRIANILAKTDTEPENILALTFTEAAAKNMRKRLAYLIGSDAYQVVINTFHSFANDIIQHYPEYFPHIIGSVAITEVDQVKIIESIILENDFELLKPFGDSFYYVRSIVSAISELKREGVTPLSFHEIIKQEEKKFKNIPDLYHEKGVYKGNMKGVYHKKEKQIAKNKELAELYTIYQKQLRKDKKYDFSDMILETVETLKNEKNLLQILQEEHQYILVDEHQDSNNAQNKILELLASFHKEYPNLFVVGDEKQSIFRFQGASLENFFYFKKQYPKAELVTLTRNYRSSQYLLDMSASLMQSSSLVGERGEKNIPIALAVFPDYENELYSIASEIKKLIKQGTEAHEIAVLYRNNNDAFGVARMFEREGIPHQIESDQDLLSDYAVQQFILLLRAINDLGDEEALVRALHLDIFNISQLDIIKVTRSASQKHKKMVLDIIKDAKELKTLGLDRPESFTELFVNLESWARYAKNHMLVDTLEEILRESGISEWLVSGEQTHEHLTAIHTFFDEAQSVAQAKPDAQLVDFFVHLDTVKEHNLRIRKSICAGKEGYVRLMTAHRSKGLEFDYVFIVHAIDGVWGNNRRPELLPLLEGVYSLESSNEDDQDETTLSDDADERRLFYVALTRARKHVVISYGLQGVDGREQLPTSFLAEMNKDLFEYRDTSKQVSEYEENRLISFKKTLHDKKNTFTQKYIRDLFLAQPLSVSALNNYLCSPWEYFYKNLLRIPAKRTKHQAYGTAVHGAVHDLFESFKKGDDPGRDFLLERFEKHLQKEILSKSDYRDVLDKGYESLPRWYDAYHGSWNKETLNEFRINGILFELPSGETLHLTGVFDKLEFIDETTVHVVDYKTGKPKTRNALLGNTQEKNKDYVRQLAFYRLLLASFKDGTYTMTSGEIDFIESDDRGKLHKEKFEITDEELQELKNDIARMADEVMHLKFWDVPCDPKKSDFCDLVEILKKRE